MRIAATRALRANNFVQTEADARQLLAVYPESAFAHLLIGDAGVGRRDTSAARVEYLTALELLRARADTLYAAVATAHQMSETIGAAEPKLAQVIAVGNGLPQGDRAAPHCAAEAGRRAERINGEVVKGSTFSKLTPGGWILRLVPTAAGWFLRVAVEGRETEDLSQLTPPWHGPNAREIEGWHFRNVANTGPNEGSVNAPLELREFIFSPDVGRRIEYNGSNNADDVAQVRSFGRGWLFIKAYVLTPPREGERAGFESLKFSACLIWPVG